jgi:hypothetical protein
MRRDIRSPKTNEERMLRMSPARLREAGAGTATAEYRTCGLDCQGSGLGMPRQQVEA